MAAIAVLYVITVLLAAQAVSGHAPAVQQHQGRIGALAAQVRAGHAIGTPKFADARDAGRGGQAVATVAGHVEEHHQLLGRGDALLLDLGLLDDGDR